MVWRIYLSFGGLWGGRRRLIYLRLVLQPNSIILTFNLWNTFDRRRETREMYKFEGLLRSLKIRIESPSKHPNSCEFLLCFLDTLEAPNHQWRDSSYSCISKILTWNLELSLEPGITLMSFKLLLCLLKNTYRVYKLFFLFLERKVIRN